MSGRSDVYVAAGDLERARQVLGVEPEPAP